MTNRNPATKSVLFLVQFSLLLAIEAIVCFTPLGSIPIGPLVATLMMLPVLIAAIVLGTGAGAAMGFCAGLFSFIVWTFTPPNPLIAFVFTPFYSVGAVHGGVLSLVICFVPRILAGVVTGGLFGALSNSRLRGAAYSVAGVLGSLVNTFLVLGGIVLFFGQAYAKALNIGYQVMLGAIGTTVLLNGIPEAVLGGIIAFAVGYPLRKYARRPM